MSSGGASGLTLPPEPPGIRPFAADAGGEVWQRGHDGLWYRPGDLAGRTWFEVAIPLGPMTVYGEPERISVPYTDELPTVPDLLGAC